ncbi:MAG: hypothetical protein MI866_21000, partial [Bacteroidales bacterium]|nr:hypothetical protein [Bacteroidales bacterium]
LCLFIYININAQEKRELKNKWLITTNSGVLKTPLGIKFGRIGKIGWNVGMRFGKGDRNNSYEPVSESLLDEHGRLKPEYIKWYEENHYVENDVTNFSFVLGMNVNVLHQKDFSMHIQGGIGYARWWEEYAKQWYNLDGGVELEIGLLLKYQKWIGNITGNYLNRDHNNAVGDFCFGVGYCF